MGEDYATFLKTSEETGGEYTLIEIELAPGGGNDPHYHLTYDEHFEVLEVLVDRDTVTLRPGQKAVAPKNVLHRFHNTTEEPARFQVELRPGHAGFEKAMKVGYGLASDGRNPLHHPYFTAVLDTYYWIEYFNRPGSDRASAVDHPGWPLRRTRASRLPDDPVD